MEKTKEKVKEKEKTSQRIFQERAWKRLAALVYRSHDLQEK